MLIRTSETFVLLWQYNGRYCRYSRNAGNVAGEGEILCFYGAFVIMKIQNFFPNLICIYGIRRESEEMMGKGRVKLKADVIVKNYWRNNERFADFFNAVLFDGKQVILPQELEDLDTEVSSILEHNGHLEHIAASRDNVKIRKKSTVYGVELVILGMEGQEHIHYAMPMRVMGYDYGTYKKQYDNIAAKYRQDKGTGLSEDEFISKMKRTDRLMPVITIVIYYGEKPWDGAVSLHGMLHIPQEMESFVNDYKLHLIEAGRNDLKLHNINNKDLFNLLGLLLNRGGKNRDQAREEVINYASQHKVDEAVVLTVAGVVNSKIDYSQFLQKGEVDMMCSVFEETWQDGLVHGKTEGKAEEIVQMGNEFGFSEEDIVERLQKKLGISLEKAQEYLSLFRS